MNTNIRRLADTGDHIPAAPGFRDRACLAQAPGAVGDCVRPTGHTGPHQGAAFWSWDSNTTHTHVDLLTAARALADAEGRPFSGLLAAERAEYVARARRARQEAQA